MSLDDTITLHKTPLYQSHVALGAKMAAFGGWLMPIQYAGILAEHAHTRSAVSVFDICHMGEFMIEGDALEIGLDCIVTQNITAMSLGSCRYGFMLNEAGGVLDDLVVYRLKKDSWMLVVNAATIAGDEAHIRKHLAKEARFENISDKTGKLDVQGPQSREVLKEIFGEGVSQLAYYTFTEFSFENERCIISRTGYTGELGYEIYIAASRVGELWDRLLKDSRVKPAGLGARDTLRLEMGYPLYGHDLDGEHTPLAAGFGRFVDLSKDFFGKSALLREIKNESSAQLIYFKADSRRSPRHGHVIFHEGKRVGMVTSGSFSPSLSVGIGMGYVRGDIEAGARLLIKDTAVEIPAIVVERPFYRKTA